MDSDRAQLPARESQAHLLPFDRVPAGSLARQQHCQSHARSGRGTTYQGQEPGLDRSARAGTRPRVGQWRVGTLGGVFSGFDGDDAVARDRLRTALRIRNVQAVDQGWLAGGAAGPLAAAHRSLANHAGSGHRRSEAELLLRDDRRKLAPRGREAVATVRHPARSSDSRIRRPNHQFTSTLGRGRARLLRLSGIQPGRFRGRARGEAGRRDSDESAVSRRFDQPGTSTAIHPGVLSGRMLAGGYHPALPAPELMRMLLDDAKLEWDQAWDLTRRTLGYTNHTLLPEALEKWPVEWFEMLIPRHLEIIFEINRRLLDDVRNRFPGDEGRLARVSLIEGDPTKRVRMANLAVVGSHSTNGVAAIHSELLRTTTVKDLAEMFPERFNNKTNGVTPRRWLLLANPTLARAISDAIGEGWITDLSQLSKLKPLADDKSFRDNFRTATRATKARFANWLKSKTGE